jgi:hypothetical protein
MAHCIICVKIIQKISKVKLKGSVLITCDLPDHHLSIALRLNQQIIYRHSQQQTINILRLNSKISGSLNLKSSCTTTTKAKSTINFLNEGNELLLSKRRESGMKSQTSVPL